jgi:hypothetical protein
MLNWLLKAMSFLVPQAAAWKNTNFKAESNAKAKRREDK